MVKRYGPLSGKLPISTQYSPVPRREEAREALTSRVRQRYVDQHAATRSERQRDTLIRNQGIFIQVSLAGPQHARAAVGHRGQVGAWVTVTIGTVVVWPSTTGPRCSATPRCGPALPLRRCSYPHGSRRTPP